MSARTRIWQASASDGTPLFFKQYRIPGTRLLFSGAARSRAMREYQALLAMDLEDLPVAAPAWFADARIGPFLKYSVLVTRSLGEVVPLSDWIRDMQTPAAEHLAVCTSLGSLARRLHDLGFGHFRMQAKNFMVRTEDGEHSLHMIDVPYACRWNRAASAAVRRLDLEDLAGAHSVFTPEQVKALMHAYRGGEDPDCPEVVGSFHPGSRSRWGQKLRRISYYLGAIWSGHRPG
ncbi:MAG: lipopolysaccharide kinase InaA family protein [Planctomycetota bacterium]|jgi:tRNA A-37 threonylcarbamoyl transferase component Bud32